MQQPRPLALDAGVRGAERQRGWRHWGVLLQPDTVAGLMHSDCLLLIEADKRVLECFK